MAKDDRLDMRIRSDLKAALARLADAQNRSLANYVETVLQAHVTETDKRGGKSK